MKKKVAMMIGAMALALVGAAGLRLQRAGTVDRGNVLLDMKGKVYVSQGAGEEPIAAKDGLPGEEVTLTVKSLGAQLAAQLAEEKQPFYQKLVGNRDLDMSESSATYEIPKTYEGQKVGHGSVSAYVYYKKYLVDAYEKLEVPGLGAIKGKKIGKREVAVPIENRTGYFYQLYDENGEMIYDGFDKDYLPLEDLDPAQEEFDLPEELYMLDGEPDMEE